jgi:3',5'-cyclic AMP phosphodiesterase CpdA
MTPGDTGTFSGQRTYDPFWTNALTFLDFLREEELIKTNPSKAVIGQFVQLTGSPWLFDMRLLQRVMSTGSMQAFVSVLPDLHEQPLVAALMLDIIPTLELGVQVTLASGSHTLWGTLLPNSMATSAGDLMLKHGAEVSGAWTVLGVLDARPDTDASLTTAPEFQGLPQMMVGISALRPMIGRPPHAYGITPLLIFREVSGG